MILERNNDAAIVRRLMRMKEGFGEAVPEGHRRVGLGNRQTSEIFSDIEIRDPLGSVEQIVDQPSERLATIVDDWMAPQTWSRGYSPVLPKDPPMVKVGREEPSQLVGYVLDTAKESGMNTWVGIESQYATLLREQKIGVQTEAWNHHLMAPVHVSPEEVQDAAWSVIGSANPDESFQERWRVDGVCSALGKKSSNQDEAPE